MKKKCIVICGTTASGKSKLADYIYQNISSCIINGDSQQVYKELPILTDQPQPRSNHHYVLYGYKSLLEEYNSFIWAKDATYYIYQAINDGKIPILIGGTGFYIRNLLYGHGDLNNADHKIFLTPDIEYIKILIMPTKEEVLPCARQRIHDMFPQVFNEYQAICNDLNIYSKAKRIIGFSEIDNYYRGLYDFETCMDKILIRTMQYSKRQRTWFRHQMIYNLVINHQLRIADLESVYAKIINML